MTTSDATTIDPHDEIVQDFLIEAGEILERLSEELVELEERPGETELLNSIFRGFHTVKGGAGFIGVEPMVELCHRAEDAFNLVRNGERVADARLLDVMLRALDSLQEMFAAVREARMPDPAPAAMMAELDAILEGEEVPASVVEAAPDAPAPDEITEDEFDSLLDELHGTARVSGAAEAEPTASPPSDASAASGDEISEEEFEGLLDALHGSGPVASAEAKPTPQDEGEITEDEFEGLLDALHGTGRPPAVAADADAPAPAVVTAKVEAPAEKVAAPAAKAAAPAPIAETPAAKVEPAAAGAAREETAVRPGVAGPGASADTTVRVATGVLDQIMNMVGELVLVRNRIATLEMASDDEDMAKAVGNLDVVTADLQSAVMRTRMQPIKKVFGRFPRVVRDLARSLGKEVDLELKGEDTDLDKNLVEALADPLIHLVRNSIDHGLETPDVREAAGKPRKGHVVLSAEQVGDQILLTVSDDGRGIDAEVLRRKVVEKGVLDVDAAARLSERECFHLIFAAGFSTKSEISEVSGRGVGMDVVKSRISQLNGNVDIESQMGVGTKILIKVPLTLAIVPTLMVVLGGQIFALPLVNVREIFDFDDRRTNVIDGQLSVVLRGRPLPLFYLSRWLVNGVADAAPGKGHVVVVHAGNQIVGFVVDELIGQEEVVIKPLGALLNGTRGLAGATITGDGRIALILDAPGILGAYAVRR